MSTRAAADMIKKRLMWMHRLHASLKVIFCGMYKLKAKPHFFFLDIRIQGKMKPWIKVKSSGISKKYARHI